MSFLSRLFKRAAIVRPDAFTLTRDGHHRTLIQWIRGLREQQRPILVLAHFPETFQALTELLDRSDEDFDILKELRDFQLFSEAIRGSESGCTLTLASLISDATPPGNPMRLTRPSDPGNRVAIICVERFPLPRRDRDLEQALTNLTCDYELGYLLSFEDPLIEHVLGARFRMLMEQLGLSPDELVSSHMSSKALRRALDRLARKVVDDSPADSIRAWLDKNIGK